MPARHATVTFFDRMAVTAATCMRLDGQALNEHEHRIFMPAYRLGMVSLRELIEAANRAEDRDAAFAKLWAELDAAEAHWCLIDHFEMDMAVLELH